MPRHGEERGRHLETRSKMTDFVLPGGETVTLPGVSVTQSVVERYCARCDAWVECKGVMGALTFIADHDEKDHQHGARS